MADWSTTEHLLALIADQLAVANWQRGSGKRTEYPKPIPRPGMKPDRDVTTLGTVVTKAKIDEMRQRTRRG